MYTFQESGDVSDVFRWRHERVVRRQSG